MTSWDKLTARAGWAMLLIFTALSSYLNARHAQLAGGATTEQIIFHAAVPTVLLVAAVFAELVALSSVHRAAKLITVTVLVGIFTVTLIASYIAILAVVTVWNPHAPAWVNAALAAVPDAAMVMAGTTVLSLRMKRHGLTPATPRTRAQGRWRRLADAAASRAEAALAVPEKPQVNAAADPAAEPVAEAAETPAEPVAEPAAEVRRPSPKQSAEPPADPTLQPFMEAGQRLAEARLVRGKTAVDYAEILKAVDQGWSPTKIKRELGFSHETTQKVREAAGERPALAAV